MASPSSALDKARGATKASPSRPANVPPAGPPQRQAVPRECAARAYRAEPAAPADACARVQEIAAGVGRVDLGVRRVV